MTVFAILDMVHTNKITRDFDRYEPLSYARFMAIGLNAAYQIRAIRAGGYQRARKLTAFYSEARWQDSEARKAVASVRRLGNPKPYYFEKRMLFILSIHESIQARRPVYYPARGFDDTPGQGVD